MGILTTFLLSAIAIATELRTFSPEIDNSPDQVVLRRLMGEPKQVHGEEYCESEVMLTNEERCKASSCCHWNTDEAGEASNFGEGRCWSSIGQEICEDTHMSDHRNNITELDAPLNLEPTGAYASYGRRRRMLGMNTIMTAGEIFVDMIKLAGNLNANSNDCQAAQALLLPTVRKAVEDMKAWTSGLADAAGWPEGDFTLYAGARVEVGFIRSWGKFFGVYVDNHGNTGCVVTECHGWGLVVQGEHGAGGGILFGDASNVAGDSVMHPFIGGAGIGPSWGIGHGETRDDSTTSAWTEEGGADFFEWSYGFGVGVELLSWAKCKSQTSDFNFEEKVCFDLEVYGHGERRDDEIHEESSCEICAHQYEMNNGPKVEGMSACKLGIYNSRSIDCIEMPKGFTIEKDVLIETKCRDALWIDRLRVGGQQAALRDYGADNQHGWCLSLDENDYKGWNSDNYAQHVTANACFSALRFRPNHGNVATGYWRHKVGCPLHEKYKCSGSKLSSHPLTHDLCLQKCSETENCGCVKYLHNGNPKGCELWSGQIAIPGDSYTYSALSMHDYATCKHNSRRRTEDEGVAIPPTPWNSTEPVRSQLVTNSTLNGEPADVAWWKAADERMEIYKKWKHGSSQI